jgi:hypothetical protein
MKKYPIGLQDFGKIRESNFLYIDKTPLIHRLIESKGFYFLSRPTQFGKSLLISTIKEIFRCNKELFAGLWIYNKWNWEQKHPVIHLRLRKLDYQKLGLYTALNIEMGVLANELGFKLEANHLKERFKELIYKAAVKGQVVILIDDYDKPVIDYLDDNEKANENRSVFISLYSVLKDADDYIRLLLITGVSRFLKVSILSDFPNLNDITIHQNYATIAGITQWEIEHYFMDEITEIQQQNPDILSELILWYSGYSWHENAAKVYNPISVLKYMDCGSFMNYAYQTCIPGWLVGLVKRSRMFDMGNVQIGDNALSNYDAENRPLIPVLFQTGYLTIKGYDAASGLYNLGYPNKEVEDSLTDALLSAYRSILPGNDSMAVTNDLSKALKGNNIPQMIKSLDALISTIPYDHWKAESESIFHIIVHLAFKRLGLDIRSEVHSATGRCDVLVQTSQYIFAIELKLDGSAQTALDQIFEKGYLRPYQGNDKKKIAIGINFSSEKRAVEGFLVQEVV